jgi:hypothetical protein
MVLLLVIRIMVSICCDRAKATMVTTVCFGWIVLVCLQARAASSCHSTFSSLCCVRLKLYEHRYLFWMTLCVHQDIGGPDSPPALKLWNLQTLHPAGLASMCCSADAPHLLSLPPSFLIALHSQYAPTTSLLRTRSSIKHDTHLALRLLLPRSHPHNSISDHNPHSRLP